MTTETRALEDLMMTAVSLDDERQSMATDVYVFEGGVQEFVDCAPGLEGSVVEQGDLLEILHEMREHRERCYDLGE